MCTTYPVCFTNFIAESEDRVSCYFFSWKVAWKVELENENVFGFKDQ